MLEEVPSVLTFKLESIFSTISRVLDWEVLNLNFLSWLGKLIKGSSVLIETGFSIETILGFSTETVLSTIFLQYGQAIDQ